MEPQHAGIGVGWDRRLTRVCLGNHFLDPGKSGILYFISFMGDGVFIPTQQHTVVGCVKISNNFMGFFLHGIAFCPNSKM